MNIAIVHAGDTLEAPWLFKGAHLTPADGFDHGAI